MEFDEFENEMNYQLKNIKIKLNEEQMNTFFSFMNILIEKNKVMNLTGITEPKEIILKHFVDSLTIAKYIENYKTIIDIGTGAGFPGIPLKVQNNTLNMVLLDSLNKRINFLNEFIEENKIKKIYTIHGRAEDFGQNRKYREMFDVATSRAVAPLNILLEYMLPFIKVGGICICMKGKITDEEIENSKNALNKLGGKIIKIEKFKLGNTDNNRTIIIINKKNKTPLIFPRNPGEPLKKPL